MRHAWRLWTHSEASFSKFKIHDHAFPFLVALLLQQNFFQMTSFFFSRRGFFTAKGASLLLHSSRWCPVLTRRLDSGPSSTLNQKTQHGCRALPRALPRLNPCCHACHAPLKHSENSRKVSPIGVPNFSIDSSELSKN